MLSTPICEYVPFFRRHLTLLTLKSMISALSLETCHTKHMIRVLDMAARQRCQVFFKGKRYRCSFILSYQV